MRTTRSDLERLIRDHQGAIHRYLRYLGAQPAVAEDLVQETFLAVLKENPNQPEHPEDPMWSAWLRGIARNLYLAECRRSQNQAVPLDDPALERAEEAWAAAFREEGDWDAHLAALQECMKLLPPRQREAIDLRYGQRTGRDEMARELKMTENGVKTRLRRIRVALSRCIQHRMSLGREKSE